MYDLLTGVRVLELAFLAPSMAGMHLADLGADVVKIEAPPGGDHTRKFGGPFRGGPSLAHLRWNRGKRSVALDLKVPAGRDLYLSLSAKADAVIDGLRAGATDRLGVGYAEVSRRNSRVVYCSLSGFGDSGPYRPMASHGFAYDAFAGLLPVSRREDGTPYIGTHFGLGMRVAPVFAALGIAAALVAAQRSGQGRRLDVAQADTAALLRSEDLLRLLNTGQHPNPQPYTDAARYQFYGTKDDRFIIFQPFERKFWETFCGAIARPDLVGAQTTDGYEMDAALGDERLRRELASIFRTRTQAEWIEFFIETDVPGGPAHDLDGLTADPQFAARENVIEHEHPRAGVVRMPTTPIKVRGARFEPRHAPDVGEQSVEVLREWLSLSDDAVASLRREGAVA